MLNTTYQRKNSGNTAIDINPDTQLEITSSDSFSNYAKVGLALVGTVAGAMVLANRAGYLPSSSRGSDAAPDNRLDNPHQLINPQETIAFADNSHLIQPRHAKRAFGSEFQVNTYTASRQERPSVTGLNTGDFVVVWESSSDNIHGQRFSSTGVPQGNEFQVNTYSTGQQYYPSVAALSTGDFVVTWTTEISSVRANIYGQRFSSTGVPQGNEFQVNTYSLDYQWRPSVVGLSTGDFVVVWESYRDAIPSSVFGQCFSSTGVLLGSEFQSNTGDRPSVAGLNTGDFVVVWSSSNGQDGDLDGIYGRRYLSTGKSQGKEFQVNTYTTSRQERPSVAGLNTGDFVVVWQSGCNSCVGQDGDQYGIYGQRFSSTGSPQGIEFQVNTYIANKQWMPSIAALTTGDFVVVWESNGQDGNSYGIYGQDFSGIGVPQGSEFQINTYIPSGQRSPSVAVLSTGDFVVVWESNGQDGDLDGIYGRIYFIPVLVNNELTVNEGEIVFLSSLDLSATDSGNNAPDLVFTISNMQYGQFESISNPGIAITSFTQQEITDAAIQFVHDGSENQPMYDVSVSDGLFINGPASANITFNNVNDTPVLVNNALTINEGETVILSMLDLRASDPDNTATELTFTVNNVQYGQFERIQNADVAITSFTQQEITNGDIQFAHDGSTQLPGYSIDVTDGTTTSALDIASIVYIVQNQLVIQPGEFLVLGPKQLDIQTQLAPTDLEIRIAEVQFGRFEQFTTVWGLTDFFALSELYAGNIRFVHDGTENKPQYILEFKDLSTNYTFNRQIIGNTILNHPPELTNPIGVLNKQVNKTFSYTLPNDVFIDPDLQILQVAVKPWDSEVFPPWIQFDNLTTTLTGTPMTVGSYSFQAIATDPYDATAEDRFYIDVQSTMSGTPTLTANTLTILEGQSVILTSSNLSADDPDDDNNSLVFTVSNVQNGQFEKVANPGTSITSFTQLEIINDNIQFVHDGNENAPYYEVSVSDGTTASTNDATTITFINVNDVPVLNNYNILITSPGQSMTLDGNYLSAADIDSDDNTLTFTISNTQNCRFELITSPGIPITSFTQQQIQNGNIQFVHTQVANLPTFQASVSDGSLSTPSMDAMTFQIINNQLVVEPGQTVPITVDNINVIGQQPATNTTIIVTNVANGYFMQTNNPGQSINNFSLQQIKDGEIAFVKDNKDNVPSYNVRFSYTNANQITPAATPDIILNHAPELMNPIGVISKKINEAFSYTLPNNIFIDPDAQMLQIIVTPMNSTLFPAWIQFNSLTTTLTGTPVTIGSYPFKAIATDPYDATAEDRFYLDIKSSGGTPMLITNALTILEGQTIVLRTSNLLADDLDDDNNSLVFTVSNVQHGQFEQVANPGVLITSFTQLEITNGEIQFTHDDTETAPYYAVRVSDGATASTDEVATIAFTNSNDVPVLTNYNMIITSPGQSITLDGTYLSATDIDSDDNTLTFTLSDTQNCRFELITSPGTPITSFTQQQIQNGNIQFVHTQVASLPTFQASVSDGSLSTTPVDAMTFQIINNQLVVEPGKTVPITINNINLLSQQSATDTMIIITNVANGYFMQTTNPGQSINSFSLQQIKDGEIAFVKDSKDNMPSYDVRLSYTNSTQITPAATPDITLNHPPVVATKIQNQQASKAKPFDFTISENTFYDPDGDPLTVSLEMQDGTQKPTWLQFQPNYRNNRHRFFGTPATPGGVPIKVVARDPYNASANADFLLQVMGNITNIVNEGTNPVPFIAAIIGGTALLGGCLTAGILYFKKAQDRKTRQQHKLAQLIRHHLKLQKVDNFKSEDGQRFVQTVEGLSGLLQEEQGIDITTMDENRLNELASSIAVSAKNKITPDTTKLWQKSKITITDFADNIEQIARDNRLDDISYAEVSDDVSIPMHTM